MRRSTFTISAFLILGALAARVTAAPGDFGESPKTATASDPPALRPIPQERPAKRPAVEILSRTWTDVYGRQVSAKFVRVFNGNVTLSRSGRMVVVRYYDLTAYDQDYVKEILTAQGEGALIPPPPSEFNPRAQDPAAFSDPPAFGPREPMPPSVPSEPKSYVPKGASVLFDEMNQRDRDLREKQAEHVGEMARQGLVSEVSTEQDNSPSDGFREPAPTPPAYVNREERKAETPASGTFASGQVTSMVLAGIVVAGVVGVVAVIVFAAFTIASASSISRHREYR